MSPEKSLSATQLNLDPVRYARVLAAVREATLSGSPAPVPARDVVAESWQRCLRAGVDPDRQDPTIVFDHRLVGEIRAAHPLAQVLPLLRSTLVGVADEAMHVMVVTDAVGNVLWMDGRTDVRRLAERISFVEGVRWSEDSVGTNAIGTAIAVDAPVQIHAAEHYAADQHVWTCAAAPIHDPDTGAMLGVVDVSGPFQTVHPATAALVLAAARLAEAHLRMAMMARDEQVRLRNVATLSRLGSTPGALVAPSGRVLATSVDGWVSDRMDVPAGGGSVLPGGQAVVAEPVPGGFLVHPVDVPETGGTGHVLALSFLGTRHPNARLDGRSLVLRLRHAELLAVLALHPRGYNAEQLALELYGEAGNPVTVRAEMHRLRGLLGDVVHGKPYRLNASVEADFLQVRRLLDAGRLDLAMSCYRGELLPSSDAPAIRQERQELAAVVRRATIDCGDVDALLRWTELDDGRDDLEAFARLLAQFAPEDPRRCLARVRYEQLRDDASSPAPPGAAARREPVRG